MLRTELVRPLPELLATHASERGDKIAFRDSRRAVSYGCLARRTARLAGHLQSRGLDRGDRVVLYMGNRVETVESYLAVTRAGAVGVCINPQAAEREAAYMAEDSGARTFITDPGHVDSARRLAARVSADALMVMTDTDESSDAEVVGFEDLAGTDSEVPARDDLGLDEPAWMLYTSGTTGRPKGVLLTQRSCLWVVAACWAPITGLSADDYVLSPLPLFHSYALDLSVLGVLATGASEYVMERFSTDRVLELLRSEPITFLAGVPTMFHYLRQGMALHGFEAAALRMCVSAGAIMPASLNREFERAAKVPLLDGYGITETSTMVTMNWPTGTRIMGSCGLAVPGSAVRVVDPATERDVGVNQEGELWVRGPHVMLGYYARPEETASVLRDGWYHTGDLGHQDENGYLTITGRIKELIIRGGENIYPAEVEEVLVGNDQVRDAAVVAQAHEELGEVPVAFVVAADPDTFDARAVLESCTGQLADFKKPANIYLIDEIPRTGSGKILRHKLQQQEDLTGGGQHA